VALSSGTKLGAHEIVAPVGVGGMGEVYRARDSRLGRNVAIKVLPASFSSDSSRLHRFEQEARAAAALNHPNILAVYDIGAKDGSPYIVSELLEGETLRERLRSVPLPVRKAIDFAQQIARGLAAAHDKGIVHRDLKPENIFVTNDGRIKILDFGLAKLVRPENVADGQVLTQTLESDPGTVLGTVGYMSPEQVRGKPADARSDLFSFGTILYEMLSGKRAFHGESAAETMSAIAREEPPELTETNRNVPPALERIVRHCLEKNPAERFHSAHDLAFDLETLSSVSSTTTRVPVPTLQHRRLGLVGAVTAAVVLSLALGALLDRMTHPTATVPSYHQLTFRRGTVTTAKFAPDGQVLYSAAWDGNPVELYATGSGSGGTVSTGIRDADIEAISKSGEMLLITNRTEVAGHVRPGTLARAPSSAAPRPILEDVQDADWGWDGNSVAVVHYVGQSFRLEFPAGRVLYTTATGWISHPRVSPEGDLVAFLEHPSFGDDSGAVSVVDLQGHKRTLTSGWSSEEGLAWSSSGKELWFSANHTGIALDLYGVDLGGKLRTILRVPGNLQLMDIGRDGRVLIAQGQMRSAVIVTSRGQKSERDLAIADWSLPRAISEDGQMVLLEEEAEGVAGGAYTVYLRKTDGSAPLRLGEGYMGRDLSRDGKWALVFTQSSPEQVVMLPTGAGEPRQVTHDAITHRSACLLSDGKHVVFAGVEPGHQLRTYIQDVDNGGPRPVTPEGVAGAVFCSSDGKSVAIAGEHIWVVPVNGGELHAIPRTSRSQAIAGWSANGQSLYIYRGGEVPVKLYRVAIADGKQVLVKEVAPADRAGVITIGRFHTTADLSSWIYGVSRNLNQLYSVQGLK
jgi:eukaryotic-like serine/threonine-protein kinase